MKELERLATLMKRRNDVVGERPFRQRQVMTEPLPAGFRAARYGRGSLLWFIYLLLLLNWSPSRSSGTLK
ncbi:MAG: hypothetical protein IPJ94_11445 [Chloroflexi bacterium]|nr:hypothetical protein [Chloroflexota bacterium]